MNLVLLCGSPRKKNAVSAIILNTIKENLQNQQINIIEISMDESIPIETDALIIATPLYVDGLCSRIIKFLEDFSPEKNFYVYGILNSGFYEARQNQWALKQLEHFCAEKNLTWAGGLAIGGGQMIPFMKQFPAEMYINKPVFFAIKEIAFAAKEKKLLGQNKFVQFNYPRFLYKMQGQKGWRETLKANGKKTKEINARPLDKH